MKNALKKLIAALQGASQEPEYAAKKCGKMTIYVKVYR